MVAASGEVADQPARLADQGDPGGHVPGVEPELPERIEAARGDVREIECGRAGAPYAGGVAAECAQRNQIPVEALVAAKGYARSQQRSGQAGNLSDPDPAVVQRRAPTPLRAE
jgi:hypothetical protein